MLSLRAVYYLFIVVAVLYFLLPYDLIPDFLGILGRLDDFAVPLFLLWRYRKLYRLHRESIKFYEERLKGRGGKDSGEKPFDPYEVLEIPRGSDRDTVEKAYKRMVKLYHPDKVNHLGEDLKRLAEEKIKDIQRAYEILKKS